MGKVKLRNRFGNSLAGFVQALEQTRVVIELRSDTIIRGKIDSVDEYMNMNLVDATVKTVEGNKRECDYLYLRGKNIRYIHLPKSMSPDGMLQEHRKKQAEARKKSALEMLARHTALPKGIEAISADEAVQE